MKEQYENQILSTIENIVDNTLSQSQYDKTIQGTIQKITDLTLSKYLVKYQDSSFEAISADKNTVFQRDDLVYVLIPNGDFNKDKTIIGKVGGNIIRNPNVYSTGDTYIKTGEILNNEKNTFSLCSYYGNQEKVLFDKENNINLLGFKEDILLEQLQFSDTFILEFQLKTELKRSQRTQGNYGIKILAIIENEIGQTMEKNLIFDINNINGNPYNISTFTTQIKLFENINIKEIKKISIFEENFLESKEIIWTRKGNSNNENYKEYYIDTKADLSTIDITQCCVGSLAYIIETQKTYILTENGQWIEW